MAKTKPEKAAIAKAKAEAKAAAKLEAEAKAAAKLEAEAKAEAKAQAKLEAKARVEAEAKVQADEEAKALGVKPSKVKLSGFKDKDPVKLEKERKRQDKLVAARIEARVAKAKIEVKMTPLDKRRALLVARFKAVKSRHREHTYSNKNIKAWIEEFKMIDRDPKAWNKVTQKGTVNFTPANKKKKTARDEVDEMDLE